MSCLCLSIPALATPTIRRGYTQCRTQLGGKLTVGRCGGIEKTSLISLTSEERRTRPHMIRT
jgi:hypothetical protein